jgi:hypothetical protein
MLIEHLKFNDKLTDPIAIQIMFNASILAKRTQLAAFNSGSQLQREELDAATP